MANRQPVWDISQVEKVQASKNFNSSNNTLNQKSTSSSKLHNLRSGQINVQTYYDIYIFEERLKQNLLQIKKIQRNYRIITLIWSLFLGYFLWCFVTYKDSTVIYNEKNEVLGYKRNKIYTVCLLITSSIGLYYLLTGKIQRKLNGPAKFTQQCNKTLKPFNLQFHGDHKYRLSFYRRIPRRFVEGYILFVTELKKRSKLKKEMQNKKDL